MTVPFEGGATPPQYPEMLTADAVAEHYRTMVTEKLGDNWTSKRPNGTRIAELGFMVPGYPYIEAPVTIYDNGEDQTRPALEIDVPDDIKEIESGVIQVGRDGVITKQSIDMVTKKPFTKVLTDSDVAVLTTLLSRNALWPRARDTRNYPGVMLGSYNHHATHKPGGVYQWDEKVRYPELLRTVRSRLLTSMLGELSQNNRLHTDQGAATQEWLTAARPEVTEGESVETFRGFGDDRLIDQVYITEPSDFPTKRFGGYLGSFGSDHFPVNSGLGVFVKGDTDNPDKFTSINESRIIDIDPDLLINRRAKDWTEFPDLPTRQGVEGDDEIILIPEDMFRRTEEPAAEPEKQNPEDK